MTARVDPNATTPYGSLVQSRVRIVTWNLWGRLGEWQARAAGIARMLEGLRPDIVCLQETWQNGGDDQAAALAKRLGMTHAFAMDRRDGALVQGVAVLSRWPLADVAQRPLPVPDGVVPRNVALRAVVDGPRGPLLVATTHLIAFPPRSAQREEQVRALVAFLAERQRQPPIAIVAGDFNAAPDSEEIRLLTGRRAPAVPGWTFLDAWETAGDGSSGATVTRTNPNSAPLLLPDLRWDYVFVSWPSGPGGVGHPVRCAVVGTEPIDGLVASDHYAVMAEVRY